MKTYGEVAPPFLTSALDGISGQLHAPAALFSGKEPPYSLDKRTDGPHSRSGRCGIKKNITPAGNQTPAFQFVTRRFTDSGCYL
jgi:hypothetical protein